MASGPQRETAWGRKSNSQSDPSLGDARARSNAVTKDVYEDINAKSEIYLTSTIVDGVYAIGVVLVNPLAEEKYLRLAFDTLVSTAERQLSRRHLAK